MFERRVGVAVVGPGAMGCLFAAKLAANGIDVVLVDHDTARARRLKKAGIRVRRDGTGDVEALPEISTRIPEAGFVLVFTKSYATPRLEIPVRTPVLTLQNGLGNVEALCGEVTSKFVMAGATSEAATLEEEGVVFHAATGLTKFGSWTSCEIQPALDALTVAGFNVEVTDSPGKTLWEKTVICCGINPVTALLDMTNGAVLENRYARSLLRDLVVEAAKVASAEGYRFEYSLVERAEEVCESTADNVSSMLQDVRAGRRTEIDYLSGAVIKRGEASFLPTPRTRVVYQLIKAMEP